MKGLFVSAIASLALLAEAAPRNPHVLHEKRSRTPKRWQRRERVHQDAILPIKIALTQNNLEKGYDLLEDVRQTGKQWTPEEIHDYFAPSEEATQTVHDWLISAGIDADSIMHYDNKGWLAFDIPASQAEDLFKTEYFEYEHATKDLDRVKVGCDEYHVPEHVANHIDYITPGIALSSNMIKSHAKRDSQSLRRRSTKPPGPVILPQSLFTELTPPPQAHQLPPDLQNCSKTITPACLRALYDIPQATLNDDVNMLGLFETGDTYAQEDLNLFFAKYAPYVPQGTHPKLDSIDGGTAPVAPLSPDNTGESDIDMQIGFSLIHPQGIVLYQVDNEVNSNIDGNEGGGFNNFLDALDGSYCNYTAYGLTGNTPGIDTTPSSCGVYKPTKVISVSYGDSEYDLPWNYTHRQCNEYMKLGLQGTTVLFASGDYGVGAPPGDDSDSGCLGEDQTVYNPSYPTCPYVLDVGATRLYPNQTVLDKESVMNVPDFISPTFGSAGGFSNYFLPPPWQVAALAEYFTFHDPGYKYYIAGPQGQIGTNGGIYNRAGRGIPDVSANGALFGSYNMLNNTHFFGTSLASPEVASMIVLINEERTVAGKGSVGFISPTLYENPWIFNDIVNGSNPNCGTNGFPAVEGWDPSTGLGTPNYPKLRDVLLAMP